MKAKDVDFFEKVKAQFVKFHEEVSILSKSKPDNPINKFKLGFINERLQAANEILKGDFKPFKDFVSFNVDDLPTNSDVVLVLSQYLDCLEAWRSAHVHYMDRNWYWLIEDGHINADRPSRYRESKEIKST